MADRKKFSEIKNPQKRVGLANMRTQPMHLGHTGILNTMIANCETAILGLGSAQKVPDEHDPWPIENRIQQARNVYGDRIKIVPLHDLGTTVGTNDWIDYVIDKVIKLGLPEPTDYYTGSEADAIWYRERFYRKYFSPVPEDVNLPDTWNDSIPEEYDDYYTEGGILRRLHIRARDMTQVPSATEIRTFMALRNDGWRRFVPYVNHELVETTYPDQFRVRIEGEKND